MTYIGRKHSEETKQKMRDNWAKGLYDSVKGRPSPFKGRHHTNEAKEKLRLSRLGKPSPWKGKKNSRTTARNLANNPAKKGDEHWNWKGGLTSQYHKEYRSAKYTQWREAVLQRDGNRCQSCGSSDSVLQVRRIRSYEKYPELRYELDNGRALCTECRVALRAKKPSLRIKKSEIVSKDCQTCGAAFTKGHKEGSNDWRIRKFCSLPCAYIGRKTNKGRIFGEDVRKKISDAAKGHTRWLGKSHSLESRKKMSIARKGLLAGDKHPNWKGGISPINHRIRTSVEYKAWRKQVFERDKYACVLCGDDSGGNLNADHIKPFAWYPELRLEVSNGRTLCEPCHRKTDTFAGRTPKTCTNSCIIPGQAFLT